MWARLYENNGEPENQSFFKITSDMIETINDKNNTRNDKILNDLFFLVKLISKKFGLEVPVIGIFNIKEPNTVTVQFFDHILMNYELIGKQTPNGETQAPYKFFKALGCYVSINLLDDHPIENTSVKIEIDKCKGIIDYLENQFKIENQILDRKPAQWNVPEGYGIKRNGMK